MPSIRMTVGFLASYLTLTLNIVPTAAYLNKSEAGEHAGKGGGYGHLDVLGSMSSNRRPTHTEATSVTMHKEAS